MAGSILIIDDEYRVRYAISLILDSSFDKLLFAENGRQGVQLFQESNPDLVLTDLIMDDGDGIEVLNTIKDLCPTTRIFVMTSSPELLDNSARVCHQPDGLIRKPFRADQLIELLSDKNDSPQTNDAQEPNL